MMTKNNIIPVCGEGGGCDRDEKVVPYTYKLVKQFISTRKKVLNYE